MRATPGTMPIPARSAIVEAAYDTPAPPMMGTAKVGWSGVTAALGPMCAFRGYNQPGDGIPAAWPGPHGGPTPTSVTMSVVSIKPAMSSVGTTAASAALATLAATIPAGQMFTCWHEGESAGNGYTAAQIQALHAWAYPIVKTGSPYCLYGQIFGSYSSINGRITNWTVPGMDFYGLDCYAQLIGDTPATRFGAVTSQIEAATGVINPVFAVCETNTQLAYGSRPDWFAGAWNWATTNNAIAFLPYFDAAGSGTAYAWDSTDSATIAELQTILTASEA